MLPYFTSISQNVNVQTAYIICLRTFSKHNFFLKFKPLRLVCCLFGDQTVFVSILSFPLFAFEYNTIKSEKKTFSALTLRLKILETMECLGHLLLNPQLQIHELYCFRYIISAIVQSVHWCLSYSDMTKNLCFTLKVGAIHLISKSYNISYCEK